MEIIAVILAIIFFMGASIGSFLNVVVERFVRGENSVTGRSHCPKCYKTLRWFELIPVLSYILQRGSCRNCSYHIPLQYVLVEAICGSVLTYIGWQILHGQQNVVEGLFIFGVFSLLGVLFMIDLKTFYLPDTYIILLTGIGIGLRYIDYHISAFDMIWGAIIGSGFLFFLWLITKGKGLGFGDVKLMIPLGLIFGVHGAILILFVAFVTGGMVGLLLLSTGKATPKTAIPFGPYLAGTAIALLLVPFLEPFFFNTILAGGLGGI